MNQDIDDDWDRLYGPESDDFDPWEDNPGCPDGNCDACQCWGIGACQSDYNPKEI